MYAVGHPNIPLEGLFLAAVKACGPDAVLSHYSAAALYGLVRWDGLPRDHGTKPRRIRTSAPHKSANIGRTFHKGIPSRPRHER